MDEAKVFIIGSGALGCEFLKNLAPMVVSCSEEGKLTITDDDVIEKSNLSRLYMTPISLLEHSMEVAPLMIGLSKDQCCRCSQGEALEFWLTSLRLRRID